jgi:NTP pyrophosphatase (non-canonical NTP hydrolase)
VKITSEIDEQFFIDVMADEIARARKAFPDQSRETTLLALVEEVGELCQAHLKGLEESLVRGEAIQVAVMAMRVVLDTKR